MAVLQLSGSVLWRCFLCHCEPCRSGEWYIVIKAIKSFLFYRFHHILHILLSLHTYRFYRLCDTHNTCVCDIALLFLLLVINCAALDHPKNGFVSSSSTVEDGTATYSCKPGFVLEGEDTRTCTSAGNWSGTEPTCRSMYFVCEALELHITVAWMHPPNHHIYRGEREEGCSSLPFLNNYMLLLLSCKLFTASYACIITALLDPVRKFSSRV